MPAPDLAPSAPPNLIRIAALVLIAILLAWIVGAGWIRISEPFAAGAAPVVGILFALIALLIASLAAQAWTIEERAARRRVRPRRWWWLAFYLILFPISALGVVNYAYYTFEGRTVLSEAAARLDRSLEALLEIGERELPNAARQKKVAAVRAALAAAEPEIVNPNGEGHCGVGKRATPTLAQITELLPAFRIISGPTPCSEAPKLFSAYQKQAENLLTNDPAYRGSIDEAKDVFLGELRNIVATRRAALASAQSSLVSTKLLNLSRTYKDVQDELIGSATAYAHSRSQLVKYEAAPVPGVSASASVLPSEVDIKDALSIGAYNGVLELITHRLNVISTWFYLAVAVILDFFLVWLIFQQMLDSGGGDGAARRPSIGTWSSSTGPQFLWVNLD